MGKQLDTLKQHLSKKEWKSADSQTKWALMELAGKSEGDLTPDDVKNIAPSDLLEIDRLWSEADSRFGFRKQAMLISFHSYGHFVDRVGWRSDGKWRNYDDIFDGDFVAGQLPYIGKKFWERKLTTSSSHTHYHPPHRHHPHPPHQHNNGHGDTGLAALGTALVAAAPWLLGAAAVVGGGYLAYQWATEDEREREIQQRVMSLLNPFPRGEVKEVWVDHNVIEKKMWGLSSLKGMRIHVKFSAANLKQVKCRCAAYFHHGSGEALRDTNNQYNTVDGGVSVGQDFVPPYEDTIFNDFTLFMPYSEFHLTTPGQHNVKFDVQLYESGQGFFAQSPYVNLTYTA